jgi:exonuclease III
LNWYFEQLANIKDNWMKFNREEMVIYLSEIKDKAKQMEKEQIEEAHYEGYCTIALKSGDYYNETYGGEN